MSARIGLAAVLYFGSVFALGFGLGVLRTIALAAAPDISRLEAVLIELPVMLAASWYASDFIARRFSVSATLAARLGMGGGAFCLLVLAEFVLAVGLRGLTLAEHFASYRDPSHGLGLLAQIGFGLFPLVQALRR